MVKVFLAPQNLAWIKTCEDQFSWFYVRPNGEKSRVWGFRCELPAVPHVGDEIYLQAMDEDDMANQLLEQLPNAPELRWIVDAIRNNKTQEHGELFSKKDPSLVTVRNMTDEEIIRELVKYSYSDIPANIKDGSWYVEAVQWIANHDEVFVLIKHDV